MISTLERGVGFDARIIPIGEVVDFVQVFKWHESSNKL
jgi:hypothetical protein